MKSRNVALFFLFAVLLVVVFGCGEDFSLLTETLEVNELNAADSSVETGGTTTINASLYYSGDATVLLYTWTASGGSIQGSGAEATYIAPKTSGTYSITLRVSDGVISDEKTIEIGVGQTATPSLILDRDTYWPAAAKQDKLAYSVSISSIATGKVLLHYDITQEQDKFDVFLSIQIGNKTVLDEMAIGGEQPSTAVRTVRDLDVSSVITSPGRYLITFYVDPGNRVENGWLMNEAKIVGVQGTSDPQQ